MQPLRVALLVMVGLITSVGHTVGQAPTPDMTGVPTQEPSASNAPSGSPRPSSEPPSTWVVPTPGETPAFPPPPGQSDVPTGLPWQSVTLELARGRWLDGLISWADGFAALERDQDDRIHALWTSTDGHHWSRATMPRSIAGSDGRLVAIQDDLLLFQGRGTGDERQLRIRIWRTRDGARWRRAGDFQWRLRAGRPGQWRVAWQHVAVVDDRLVLFTTVDTCCGSGGEGPRTIGLAQAPMGQRRTETPHQGLVVWTSEDGRRWSRRPNRPFRGTADFASVDQLVVTSDGLLATRLGGPATVLRTRDGIHWDVVAELPSGYDWTGSQGLVDVGGTIVIAGDDGGPGQRSMGNRLGVWRLDTDGTWSRAMDMQPAFTQSMASVDGVLVVAGSSWNDWDDSWPWIAVSLDGGHTWDEGLSWIGARGGCLGDDIASVGRRVVVRDCRSPSSGPTLWVTDVPGPEDAAPGRSIPEPSTAPAS